MIRPPALRMPITILSILPTTGVNWIPFIHETQICPRLTPVLTSKIQTSIPILLDILSNLHLRSTTTMSTLETLPQLLRNLPRQLRILRPNSTPILSILIRNIRKYPQLFPHLILPILAHLYVHLFLQLLRFHLNLYLLALLSPLYLLSFLLLVKNYRTLQSQHQSRLHSQSLLRQARPHRDLLYQIPRKLQVASRPSFLPHPLPRQVSILRLRPRLLIFVEDRLRILPRHPRFIVHPRSLAFRLICTGLRHAGELGNEASNEQTLRKASRACKISAKLCLKGVGVSIHRVSRISVNGSVSYSIELLQGARLTGRLSLTAQTEGGAPLRPMFLPANLISQFVEIAQPNTDRNIETCGLLLGRLVSLSLTHCTILD